MRTKLQSFVGERMFMSLLSLPSRGAPPLVQVFGKPLSGMLKFAELNSSYGFIEDDGLKPRGLVE